jgi:hypothetical protein
MIRLLASLAALSASALAADIPYTCSYGNGVQDLPPSCETIGGKITVLCQYFVYPLNHVYCQESPTHRHDLCERSLDQAQLVPTRFSSIEECAADPAALEALCYAREPAPVISGIAQCGG